MANNEHVNKVEYFGQTIMDITDTTAQAGDVDSGKVFYAANGLRTVGTGDSVKTITMNGTTYSPTSGEVDLGTVITDNSGKADKANTVLDNTLSMGRKANTTVGTNSLAFGNDVTASSNYTVAIGLSTKATSSYAKAEGRETTASGAYSHAEGGYSTSQGNYSHAEGNSSLASGIYCHAEGSHTTAEGQYSHAEGKYTYATGSSSHVSGRYNVNDSVTNYPAWVSGTSYQVGDKVCHNNTAYICSTANSDSEFDTGKWALNEYFMFAEIVGNGTDSNNLSNARALDWDGNEHLKGTLYVGCNTDSTGGTAVATATDLSGKADKAGTVLDTTLSRGRAANNTVGTGSFAFGEDVTASGDYSHAEGTTTTASGNYSHAEGRLAIAAGVGSHAEGKGSSAQGNYSHSEGEQTIAYAQASHVVGRYNSTDTYVNWDNWVSGTEYSVGDKVQRTENNKRVGYVCKTANSDVDFDSSNWDKDALMNYVEIVGNGQNTNSKSNARAVDWDGNEYLKGTLYVECDADSTGGTPVSSYAPHIGEIKMWSGTTAPAKWKICDGSVISRETYSELFTVISTTYGGGDGSTTFAIPDFKGRSPLGVGESAATGHTAHTLGQKAGEETHVLQTGELASHAHTFSKATATTTIKYSAKRGTGSENTPYNSGTGSTSNWATTTLSLTLNNTGSNTAHNTMHPYVGVNFIIYTGVEEAA